MSSQFLILIGGGEDDDDSTSFEAVVRTGLELQINAPAPDSCLRLDSKFSVV